jgi:hypothetical protein
MPAKPIIDSATAAPPSEPARDPAQPVGTPPAGGCWTWDVNAQAWAPLPDQPAPGAAPTDIKE